jgi:hypothetical protein
LFERLGLGGPLRPSFPLPVATYLIGPLLVHRGVCLAPAGSVLVQRVVPPALGGSVLVQRVGVIPLALGALILAQAD